MKTGKIILAFLMSMVCWSAAGQFSISKVKPSDVKKKEFIDSTVIHKPVGSIANEYFDREFWKAEKRNKRKERNTVEFLANLQLTQNQFENWAPGGSNTFSGQSRLYFVHTHQRKKISIQSLFDGYYGISYIDKQRFKDVDNFRINELVQWQIHPNWSYSASANLASQFSTGYRSRADNTRISTFMAPGILDVGVGVTFTKGPWRMVISGVGGRGVFLLDDRLSAIGGHGVEAGRKSSWMVGPSADINYNKAFKDGKFSLSSRLYAFTNIKKAPNGLWQTTFNINATKLLTTKLYYYVVYNKETIDKIQINYSIGLGLTYQFRNK